MTNVVLAIDPLNDFCAEGGVFFDPNCKAIIPSVKNLAEKRIRENWEIVLIKDRHLESINSGNDPEIDFLGKHAMAFTWGGETVKELQFLETRKNPWSTRIFKNTFDGFLGYVSFDATAPPYPPSASARTLEKVLRKIKPKVVEIVGVYTDVCIFHTTSTLAGMRAAERFDFDFDIVIYRDCVATSNNEAGERALNHLEKWFGVEIIDTAPK